MDIKKLILDYLENARLMQLATSVDDKPWACTVYFAYDEKMNLYWVSLKSRRHSQEVRKNKLVAGAIVLPHTPGDKVRGLQFEGVAQELHDKKEIEIGMKKYVERYPIPQEHVDRILKDTDVRSCYRIKPSMFVLFDELNFPDNPRKEFTV